MDRFARRAALRAVVSGVVAGAVALPATKTRNVAKHAALGAAAAGAAFERPAFGAPIAIAALAAAIRSPRNRAAAIAAGGVIAAGLTKVWPVAPREPVAVKRARRPTEQRPIPGGEGLAVVINPSAGSPRSDDATEAIRERLPKATLIEIGDGDDVRAALERAAGADAIGISGGDGSVNAAVGVARDAGKPLLVIPTGTLNHFARDLGIDSEHDAIDAVVGGDIIAVDTASIDGEPFVNTASLGTYSDLVDARERLEDRIGKWPALVVALARLLRTAEPIDLELDGRVRQLWMVFVGNCAYSPPGFAPAWRERLDDGLLDVRLVDASHPFARTRLLVAVLTGRLARTAVYESFCTTSLRVRCRSGAPRLARDGETFDGRQEFEITKGRPLLVYVRPPDDPSRWSQRPRAINNAAATATPAAVSQGPPRS